jgi:hypothetical protein
MMYGLYVYPIRLCMHEKMFYVASKHCRANLASGRILVKRQILSVQVNDKLFIWMFYVKRVRYESKTISKCVARKVPNHDVLR